MSAARTVRAYLIRFLGDRRGALLAEAAFTISIMVGLMLSGAEIARYALLHQKLERIAASVSDLVAQAETISEADIVNIFDAVEHVSRPFTFGPDGVVIVSSISASGGSGPVMNWQRIGAGSLSETSQIGIPGGTVTLPAGMAVVDGETLIAAEVTFEYQPWLVSNLIGTQRLYHTAMFRPRFGSLTTVDP